jgi:glyoxylase-like metal-dependent hydrolase (beta-lactamase superfamily II)
MLHDMMEVVQRGEGNGNHMIVRLMLPSGLEILGLPTENFYGGDWDLGPTWNYLVLADRPFLVDTGRTGQGNILLEKLKAAGVSGKDLAFVLLTHGHEDHDGGLSEIVQAAGVRVKAHALYDRLIRCYPDHAPPGVNRNFPASCWHCPMPESFSNRNCLTYHRERSRLEIDTIGNGETTIMNSVVSYHLPGHSPDALAFLLGEEVLLVGDTLLPDISPHPTRLHYFDLLTHVFGPEYPHGDSIYGLGAYIRSLKKLERIGARKEQLILLPGHRLFYNNRWNEMELNKRVRDLLTHHVARCAHILENLKQGPKTARELASASFDAALLKGAGIVMAENEILSHCELLQSSGDVVSCNAGRFEVTGTSNFESVIEALEPESYENADSPAHEFAATGAA